jgi:hypothetical protein
VHTGYTNATFAVASDWGRGDRDWITRQLEYLWMVVAGHGRGHD